MILKAGNRTLDLHGRAKVMAIVNLTPDSFFEPSRIKKETIIEHISSLIAQGASVIDVGAQSTAPHSTRITADEELERLIEPLRTIRSVTNLPISVDTYFPQVAEEALKNGADIINDVSGRADGIMSSIAAKYGAAHIIMHTGGLSSSFDGNDCENLIDGVNAFFKSAVQTALSAGLPKDSICLDPGFGFGKTRNDDIRLINSFDLINSCGCPLLAAVSRKRVTRLCSDSLTGTVIANAQCILKGADIIRVHDVAQGVAAAEFAEILRNGAKNG